MVTTELANAASIHTAAAHELVLEILLNKLPPSPCSLICLVDHEWSHVLIDLAREGYLITCVNSTLGIECDKDLAQDIVESFGQPNNHSSLEAKSDAILILGMVSREFALELLPECRALLAAGKEIFIVDKFSLQRTTADFDPLPFLPHFCTQAKRVGFKLTELTRLNVDPNATHAHVILKCVPDKAPRWRIGLIAENNHSEMLALFKTCFGHDMSSSHWVWKYGQGRGQAIGIWDKDKLIAHYGGTTRLISYFGVESQGLQPGDVMVHPDARGSLSRTGPFFLSAATFLELYQGYGTKHLVALGFPSALANKLPKLLGLYFPDEVDHMVEISWQPAFGRARFLTEVRPLTNVTKSDRKVVDRLWLQMHAAFIGSVIAIKNWDYIQHRYLDHPDKDYEVYVVKNRFSRKPCGVFVCRQQGSELELLDLIASPTQFGLLVQQAKRVAAGKGCTRLYCWIAAHYSNYLLTGDENIHDLGISIPSISWTAGPSLEQLHNRCWLMGGDTDFR